MIKIYILNLYIILKMTILDTLIDKEYLNEDEQVQLIMYISTFEFNKSQLQNIIETINAIIEIKTNISSTDNYNNFNDTLKNKLTDFENFLRTCYDQCEYYINKIDEEIIEFLEKYKVKPDDIQEVKYIKNFIKTLYEFINELDDKDENIMSKLNNEYGDKFIFIIKTIKILIDNLNEIYERFSEDNYVKNKELDNSLIYAENIKDNNAKNFFKIILHKIKNKQEIDDIFINIFNDLYELIFNKKDNN